MLDARVPKFGHFPLIKTISGDSLSKRFGTNSINQLRKENIFPIVILNYLSKVGTSKFSDDIVEIEKLIAEFDIKVFSKNSILYDPIELNRLNSKYLKIISYKNLIKTNRIKFSENFWKIIQSNIENIQEAYDWNDIFNKELKLQNKVKINNNLKKIIIDELPEKITADTWSEWTKKILEIYDIKPKELYTKLRMVLTGKNFGPGMNNLLTLLSNTQIQNRIKTNSEE